MLSSTSDVLGNHNPVVSRVGRGGDLYIRYTDGTLCNITREAGFGAAGVFQGADSIGRKPLILASRFAMPLSTHTTMASSIVTSSQQISC